MSENQKGGTLDSISLSAEVVIHTRPPENHEIYNLIGRVSSEWAQLEHVLDMLIWRLSGLDGPAGHCITGQLLGHAPRFYAVIALLKHHGFATDLQTDAVELMNRTENLSNKRNRIVHDAWYVEHDMEDPMLKEAQQFKGAARNELRKVGNDMRYGIQDTGGKAEVEKVISAIRSRCDEVARFRRRVLNARGSYQD